MTSSSKRVQALKHLFPHKKILLALVLFGAAVVVAVVAVLFNEAFLWGTRIARERFFDHPSLLFITVPTFFLVSAWLCRKFAPNAAGSGPEHVIAALEKLSEPGHHTKDVSEYLSLKILVVKIVSSIICIAGGGALGREGPVVQISASIFLIIEQRIKHVLPSFDIRTWIVAGSAAGVVAAFNTPLAGIIFAIEELSRFHFEQQFASFKIKAFFAVIVAGVAAQSITGSYVLFGFPVLHFSWAGGMAFALLAVSVVCGLMAWLLKEVIGKATRWRNTVTGNAWYLIPIVAGLIVASVSYVVGRHSFGAGFFSIQEVLQDSTPILSYKDTIGRFINIIATAAAGCAGGLLLPALAIGAGVGSMGSMFLPLQDSRILVAAGMAAFLGAMLNAPLTAAVLVLEVTNQREMILPLFLSTLVALWVYQSCGKLAKEVAF